MSHVYNMLASIPLANGGDGADGSGSGGWNPITIGILVVLLIVILVVVGILWRFIGLYIRAWISGASVGLFDLIGMSLRKVNPLAIVNARIQAVRAGLDVTTPEPLAPSDPLWNAPNCFITPHTAGGQQHEFVTLVNHFVENLGRFERGEPLRDQLFD